MLKKFASLLCVCALTLTFVGCEQANDAAAGVDAAATDAAQATADAAEGAADAVQGAANDAAEAVTGE
jgi:hypothetical protein